MKERERETSAYYYTRASLASAPRSPGRRKTSGGSPGIARWSKGMKMTCYLHCFGTVVLDGGVAKYLERWGLENMSKCCRVSWTINSFFPLLYRFVSQAYVLCSGQVSVNNLTGKTNASQPLTPKKDYKCWIQKERKWELFNSTFLTKPESFWR